MKFKNKTNSYALWIDDAKTMIVWGDKGIADVTDKKAIKYLQDKGYMQVPTLTSTPSTPNNTTKKA